MKRITPFIKKNIWTFVLSFVVILLQIPLITPLLRSGYFPNHDDVQVVRVFEIFQSIQYGDFPPRWSAGLLYGHGYPVFVFYAPFAYLIAAVFVLFGFTFLTATKLTFIFSFFLGALGMYFCVRALWGDRAAFVSAIVYSYIPYRSVDIYVRGNIAEFFAFSFFPWIVWANIRLINANNKLFWSLILGLFLGILAISHNISAFVYGQFLLLFNLFWLIVVSAKERLTLVKYLFLAGMFGILLSCFFWLPLLVESKYVLVGDFKNYPYHLHFLTFSQIWDTPWGYGGFTAENPMSLQFGKIALILSGIVFVFNFLYKTKFQKLLYFFVSILVIFTLLETRLTEGFWKTFSSILSFMQFPWRYHILTTFAAAILSGGLIYLLSENLKQKKLSQFYLLGVIGIIVVAVIFENIGYFKPEKYTSLPSVSETTTWNDEYLPRWVKSKPKDYASDKVKFFKGSGELSNINWGYLEKSFRTKTSTPSAIEISHIYYPGWKARINGKEIAIDYKHDTGLMRVSIPEGEHHVSFSFERTFWRFVSETISLISLFLLGILLLISLRYSMGRFIKSRKKDEKN